MSVRELRLVVVAEEYDAAVGFYRDVLGMPEQAAVAGPGGAEVTILDAGRATFEIANPAQRAFIDEVEVGRAVAPRIRLAFEVDDVAGVTGALVAAGATEIAGPRPTPFGSVNARLEAPAELQITLFQRDKPAPAGHRQRRSRHPGRAARGLGGDLAVLPADRRGGRHLHLAAGHERGRRPGGLVPGARPDRGRVGRRHRGRHRQDPAQPRRPGRARRQRRASWSTRRTAVAASGAPSPSTCWPAAAADGYRAMQFNAVVATNAGAVALWRSLGFTVVGAVPDAFDHPTHGPVALLDHAPPAVRTDDAFAVFAEQDSGCRSYGVRRAGHRWFVKTAFTPPAAEALTRVVALHRAVRHPAVVRPVALLPGPTLVYPWVDGEVLNAATTRGSDRAALARFRRLPVGAVEHALDRILDAHRAIAAAGWVSVDLYDGCFLHDFDGGACT